MFIFFLKLFDNIILLQFIMKRIILTLVVLFYSFQGVLFGQEKEMYNLFLKYSEYYHSGNFRKAEEVLLQVVNPQYNPNRFYFSDAYNNLGVVNLTLGNYDKALEYNLKAEAYISKSDPISQNLADIYNNRGRIYNIKKSFDLSIEYLEKSIRIYQNLGAHNKLTLDHLSLANINISIAFIETKNYLKALRYLEKNVKLNLSVIWGYSEISM